MERYWDYYRVEGLSPDDPRVAPRRESEFSQMPPTRIHGAEYDPLRDEGECFAQCLIEAGVPVRHVVHAGLIHHFYGLGGVIPAARPRFGRSARICATRYGRPEFAGPLNLSSASRNRNHVGHEPSRRRSRRRS